MSVRLSPDDQRSVVAEAARAPSVHNTQPTRWRFDDDGSLVLFRAVDRTLPVADPTGHDLHASLGAAFEGTALALSSRGLRLGSPLPERNAAAAGCEPVVRATIESAQSEVVDPLAAWVANRRSFRGKFLPASPQDLRALSVVESVDARVVTGAETLRDLATQHDSATWVFESRPEYHAELWSWLRLSPTDPRYHRDGLNADCLALSAPERWFAARLLVPSRFRVLKRLGIARYLISEAPQVRSAAAAILFCPLRTDSAFDVGRRMYRLWLEITAAGFYLSPMSASADDTSTRTLIEQRFGIPSERRLANVFRVGRSGAPAESPRLSVKELIVL